MNNFMKALGALIAPALNYAEQELESVGASVLAGMGVILQAFTSDQRSTFANVIAFWQAHYQANTAAGQSVINAAESATTASLNEFCKEEGGVFTREIQALLTLLESAAKTAGADLVAKEPAILEGAAEGAIKQAVQ